MKLPILQQHFNLANLTTSFGVLLGFISLILIIEQYNRLALSLYLFVLLFDRLDGFVARKYNISSEFGKELDSLADAFNFCILPAVISYLWGFHAWWMVVASVFYILMGIWKLAYFNINGTKEEEGKHYVIGIPTTLAAAYFLIIMSFHPLISQTILMLSLFVFFSLSAVLFVASLHYAKNGFITNFMTLFTPLCVVMMWLY